MLRLPEATLNVLQWEENCATRIISCIRLRDHHLTPVMLDLHWLSIWKCIGYKILNCSFLIMPYQLRQLRLSSLSLLVKKKAIQHDTTTHSFPFDQIGLCLCPVHSNSQVSNWTIQLCISISLVYCLMSVWRRSSNFKTP